MFLGTHSPRLDDKGRLILPAKFRDKLAGGLVVTRGQERSLSVFPMAAFEAKVAELSAGAGSSKAARDYLRVLLAGASDEVPDKQGRITLPPPLRAYAGLDRDLAVIGAGDHLEVWDARTWEDYLAAQEEVFSETSEGVVGSP
ncbi:division/cell wall cluster transcriptional repressor MraZ [Quadrisphaera sp. GCM10027208]|uniref:division/cell wall cluster transcriptional repressor MraZ n=1 Tax=Quadrisphaera sp. GCM10027208 TaxID=3273423 RepID=UPI00361FAE78|nr:division/cell wall cluster transcriptional repressor MraZ [Kineosporiaceae bacterium SCSIO 59966]